VLERWSIAIVVTLAAVGAALLGIFLPEPEKLPAAALGSSWVLYVLRALAIFYGFLLLFVPVFRSIKGQLPIELSFRGARYEETQATSTALKGHEDRLVALERGVPETALLLKDAVRRIEELEARATAQQQSAREGAS
jgi:hypothetical protein